MITYIAKKQEIEFLAAEYGAQRIPVFGSVVRSEERADSNINFLVVFPEGYDLFQQRLPLAEKLMKLTGRKVDLVPEHELNRYLRQAVLNEARSL